MLKESHDYDQLTEAWTGWHTISPVLRDKFTRYAELSNKGAKEYGFKDLGDLWRAGYDMSGEAFEADIERLWSQVNRSTTTCTATCDRSSRSSIRARCRRRGRSLRTCSATCGQKSGPDIYPRASRTKASRLSTSRRSFSSRNTTRSSW